MVQFIESRKTDLMILIRSKVGSGLRSKVELEDIYQELCQTAVENFREVKFDERGPFGWLVELVSRKVVDLKRGFQTQKRDLTKEVGIHNGGSNDQVELANILVASITSPSKAFSRKQKQIQIHAAIDGLTAEQKTVLHLRFAKGLDTRQIAERVGKTDGATRVLISRSLARIRDCVGQTTNDDGSR